MKYICFAAVMISLTGCVNSSGVLPMGPDTYSISVHAAPVRGQAGAKKAALTEANQYCLNQGKTILVKNMDHSTFSSLQGDDISIIFQCLSVGDSGLQRPNYQSPADVNVNVN